MRKWVIDMTMKVLQGVKALVFDVFGPGKLLDLTPDPTFDIVATDMLDLARQLGV